MFSLFILAWIFVVVGLNCLVAGIVSNHKNAAILGGGLTFVGAVGLVMLTAIGE